MISNLTDIDFIQVEEFIWKNECFGLLGKPITVIGRLEFSETNPNLLQN